MLIKEGVLLEQSDVQSMLSVRQHLLLVQLRVVCILQKISALLNLMMSLILALLRNLRELCR